MDRSANQSQRTPLESHCRWGTDGTARLRKQQENVKRLKHPLKPALISQHYYQERDIRDLTALLEMTQAEKKNPTQNSILKIIVTFISDISHVYMYIRM